MLFVDDVDSPKVLLECQHPWAEALCGRAVCRRVALDGPVAALAAPPAVPPTARSFHVRDLIAMMQTRTS